MTGGGEHESRSGVVLLEVLLATLLTALVILPLARELAEWQRREAQLRQQQEIEARLRRLLPRLYLVPDLLSGARLGVRGEGLYVDRGAPAGMTLALPSGSATIRWEVGEELDWIEVRWGSAGTPPGPEPDHEGLVLRWPLPRAG